MARPRPAFDPRHEFVVTPPGGQATLAVGGVSFGHGDPMDRSLVSARRLRQMYDARLIAIAPGSKLKAARKPKPGAVGPTDHMLTGADMLAGKKSARPRAPRRVPLRRQEGAQASA